MSSANLAEYLRVVSNDIFSLQQEIGCASSPLYETNMMETWQSLVKEYQSKLEDEKTSLIAQCDALQSQIAHKHRLLGEEWTESSSIAPPYRKKLSELNELLSEVSIRSEEKEKLRAEVSKRIDELCAQLKLAKPAVPDLLTEAALNEYLELESRLMETRSNRLKLVHECDRQLLMWRTYLGKPHRTNEFVNLDETAIEQLKHTCMEVQKAYEARFREIEAYESEIQQLSCALQVSPELPSNQNGGGTQSRVDALESRLHDLKLLRLAKLPELVQTARENLAKKWDQIFFDHSLRNAHIDEPPSEDLLNLLNSEQQVLNKKAEEPLRAKIIAGIRSLQSVFATETKLRNLSNDPQKLAKGGFMTIIKEEGRMRTIVSKHKPEIVSQLRKLLSEWRQHSLAETFYLDGEKIETKLQSDDLSKPKFAPTSLKRPRPPSSVSVNLPTKRTQPLSNKLVNQAKPQQIRSKPSVKHLPAIARPVLPAMQSTGIIDSQPRTLNRAPVVQSASQQARNAAISQQIRAAGSIKRSRVTSASRLADSRPQTNVRASQMPNRAVAAVPVLASRDPNALATSRSRLDEVVKKNRATALNSSHQLKPKRPHTSPGSFFAPVEPPRRSAIPNQSEAKLSPNSDSLRLDDNHQLVPANLETDTLGWKPILTNPTDVESSFFANESVVPANSPCRLSMHRDCSAGF